jgi:hypothetical protein
MMAKMVLRELMDPLIFMKFKSFLMKVQHASPTPPLLFFFGLINPEPGGIFVFLPYISG